MLSQLTSKASIIPTKKSLGLCRSDTFFVIIKTLVHPYFHGIRGRSQNFELGGDFTIGCVWQFQPRHSYYLVTEIFFIFIVFLWVRIKLFLFRIFLRAGLFILDKIG